mgnify:CR=1 FL=1
MDPGGADRRGLAGANPVPELRPGIDVVVVAGVREPGAVGNELRDIVGGAMLVIDGLPWWPVSGQKVGAL